MSQFYIPSKLPRKVHRTLHEQNAFGGLEDPTGATGDKCRAMQNISPVSYPTLSVRRGWQRYAGILPPWSQAWGMIYHDQCLYISTGATFCRFDGQKIQSLAVLSGGEAHMAVLDNKIYIFPDKKVYDIEKKTLQSMGVMVTLGNDTSSHQNILSSSSIDFTSAGFAVGDGIKLTVNTALSGVTTTKYYVIREISQGEMTLDRPVEMGLYGGVLEREVPDLQNICVCQNRLWGYDGQHIYACATGNPRHWRMSDMDEDSSGSTLQGDNAPVCLTSPMAGDFEAVTSWQDGVVLFRQDAIVKVLGSRAGLYTLATIPTVGVAHGEAKSLCCLDGWLYYMSGHGVYRYDGGYPQPLPDIPQTALQNTTGGSDGRCYYLAGTNEQGEAELYAYDPDSQSWYTQEDVDISYMAQQNHTLWMITKDGALLHTGGTWGMDTHIGQDTAEQNQTIALQASVTFCDEVGCILEGVRLHKLYLSCHVAEKSQVKVLIAYDGDGDYREIGCVSGAYQGWAEMPLPAVRCRYYHLKLEMIGDVRVYALHKAYERGEQ